MFRQSSEPEINKQNLENTRGKIQKGLEGLAEKINAEINKNRAGNEYSISRVPKYETSSLLGFQASDKGFIFIAEVTPKTNRKDLNYKVFYRRIQYKREVVDNKVFNSFQVFDGFGAIASKYSFSSYAATEENSATSFSQDSIEKTMSFIAFLVGKIAFGENGVGNEELEKRQNTLGGMIRGVKEKLFYENNKILSTFVFDEKE